MSSAAEAIQPGKWIVPWLGPLLHPSPFGKGLLEKPGIDNLNAPLCIAFIEEFEGVFEAAGVAWSDEQLIPIARAKAV